MKRCSYSVLQWGRKVGRRRALVTLGALAVGAWLATPGQPVAGGGGSVVYLPLVQAGGALVWDGQGSAWDGGAVWG